MRYSFEPGTIQTGFDCHKNLGPNGAFAVIVDRIGRADTVAHAITLGHTEDLAHYRARRLAARLLADADRARVAATGPPR